MALHLVCVKCPICNAIADPSAVDLGFHDRRVGELLTANNELLERARDAETQLAYITEIARQAVMLAGEMAKLMGPKTP